MKENKGKIKPGAKSEKKAASKDPVYLIIIFLIVTFVAFILSLKSGFITTWDDNVYMTDNLMIRHLDWNSIKGFFTTAVNGTYVPLPLLSYAIEYRLFGFNPLPYHFSNLLLHLGCTLLVFHFFRLLKFEGFLAAFGALLFGIHPMHVESVAWITERKDLLFALFFLASMNLYIKYRLGEGKNRKLLYLSLLFFVFSLFSKIQAVTLPLVLFLIDYLLRRPFKSGLIFEKIPYLALSLVFGVLGIVILGKEGAFHQPYSIFQGIFIGSYALDAYLLKFVAPIRLSAFYPNPLNTNHPLTAIWYLSPVLLIVVAYLVFRSAKHTRSVIFGSLFFLLNIIFLLQIVPVGSAFAADRFTYIPYIGLIFIVLWAARSYLDRKKESKGALAVVLSIIALIFIPLTFNRCRAWKSEDLLWTDVIEKFPEESALPYCNRAVFFNNQGQWERTIDDCSKAISINPNEANAFSNRGIAYANLGAWDMALADDSMAIALNPALANAYSNRGAVYLNLKEPEKAISDFSKAIGLKPDDENALTNRGIAYGNMKEWDKALADYARAIDINPGFAKAYLNRGAVYVNLNDPEKALADYSKAISLNPNYARAYFNRGVVYDGMGQYEKAIEDYTSAINLDPNLNVAALRRDALIRKLQGIQP